MNDYEALAQRLASIRDALDAAVSEDADTALGLARERAEA